jgi:hypothetical protein
VAARGRGVHEDGGVALIQGVEHGVQGLVAEVQPVVVGVETYAGEVEFVETVLHG